MIEIAGKSENVYRYLSLSWGVQSFTIAAMIANGDLPNIDSAIFSDTTHKKNINISIARKIYTVANRKWT